MSSESTTTQVTGIINTSLIDRLGLMYQIDPFTAAPTLRMSKVPEGSKTAAIFVPTKSSGVAGLTDGTAMSNSTLAFSNTTIAYAEVGILRLITKMAARSNILGEAGLYQFAIEDGTRLCLEKFETDIWSQWTNASTSCGTSGTNFKISDFAAGVSQLAINKAQGPYVAHLSTYQARDLRAAIAASTATQFVNLNNGLLKVTGNDGYMGNFMGVEVYTSNQAQASGSDKLGVIMVNGAENPQHAATVAAYGWMPEAVVLSQPQYPGQQIAVTMAYGLSEVLDGYYVKAVSIGS